MNTAALDETIRTGPIRDLDDETIAVPRGSGLAWVQLPLVAQAYVVLVGCAGAFALVRSLPQTFNQPLLFAGLLTAACFTSLWTVNLPLPLTSGSTLSVSYAADLMALLLLGPNHAVVIAVAGVLAQCTIKVKAT